MGGLGDVVLPGAGGVGGVLGGVVVSSGCVDGVEGVEGAVVLGGVAGAGGLGAASVAGVPCDGGPTQDWPELIGVS